jgi:hypothetical protein
MNKKMAIGFFTAFILIQSGLNAQLRDTRIGPPDSISYNLSFDFASTWFFKNNEYSNDFTRGFTGIGYLTQPRFAFAISEKSELMAGAFLQQYSGRDGYSKVIPLFSITQKLGRRSELIFGHIKGTLNHELEEPLLRFDSYYLNAVEYGFQLRSRSKAVRYDFWLNWQDFIEEGDAFQEAFQLGWTSALRLTKTKLSLYWPIQVLVTHRGGEIDSSEEGVLSVFNLLSGIQARIDLGSDRSLSLEPLYFYFTAPSVPLTGINALALDNGHALYVKLSYKTKVFNILAGYWQARNFFAPGGESLFHSISDYKSDFTQENRSILNAKMAWSPGIFKNMDLSLRLDFYYDTEAQQLAHAAGLYLVFNERFFLRNLFDRRL